LIDAGADVNAHDESRIGDTALLLAVQHGLFDIAKILVEHGADPTIPGWMGRTPLDHARDRKRMPELYDLLKSAPRRRMK
ncbi:MAG: ankyrin repeat domain-containing protein, partial [Candidatus Eremiobacteraeota bacterium]|nr:ankyrin repeat domain-containing protein [Candidatus Eremiobacteraeota bacterium]